MRHPDRPSAVQFSTRSVILHAVDDRPIRNQAVFVDQHGCENLRRGPPEAMVATSQQVVQERRVNLGALLFGGFVQQTFQQSGVHLRLQHGLWGLIGVLP